MWICVYRCVYVPLCMCVKVGGNLWESVLSFYHLGPRIKFSLSDWLANAFNHWATSLAPIPSLFETCYLAQAILELVTILLLSIRITGMHHNAQQVLLLSPSCTISWCLCMLIHMHLLHHIYLLPWMKGLKFISLVYTWAVLSKQY